MREGGGLWWVTACENEMYGGPLIMNTLLEGSKYFSKIYLHIILPAGIHVHLWGRDVIFSCDRWLDQLSAEEEMMISLSSRAHSLYRLSSHSLYKTLPTCQVMWWCLDKGERMIWSHKDRTFWHMKHSWNLQETEVPILYLYTYIVYIHAWLYAT